MHIATLKVAPILFAVRPGPAYPFSIKVQTFSKQIIIKYITTFMITSLKWTACTFLVLGVVGIVADIDLIVCQPVAFRLI